MDVNHFDSLSFRVSVADTNWIYNNLQLSPRKFVQGLIQSKFVKSHENIKSDIELARVCIDLIRNSPSHFEDNLIDKNKWKNFLNLNLDTPNKVISEFYFLWRGYYDDEVENVKKNIIKDKSRLKKLVAKAKKRNLIFLKQAQRKGNERQKNLFIDNKKCLEHIESDIEEMFNDLTSLSHEKLFYSVYYRRHESFSKNLLGYLPDDYSYVEFRLNRCDPNNLNFPLRFLKEISTKSYSTLKKKWIEGARRDDLMLLAEEEVINKEFFDFLLEFYDAYLKSIILKDRILPIKEMFITAISNCYLATTLLAVTQIEGVLWDFAKYLNKRVRIYKNLNEKKHPYEWDSKNKRYKKYRATNRINYKVPNFNQEINLISARMLLEKTRMGSIFHLDIYSYLIDEFYEDRNKFSHGAITNRNLKADAIATLLCLRTCFITILNYLKGVHTP